MVDPTLKDVAEYAGVAVSTVSVALRGGKGVSEATRLKVMDAVNVVGYQRRWSASTLRSGPSRLVAGIIDFETIDDPSRKPHLFWSEAISCLGLELEKRGLRLVLSDIADLQAINELPIDGAVVISGGSPELPETLPFNLPVMVFDEHVEDPRIKSRVGRDFAQVADRVLSHLVEAGARRVAYLPRVSELAYASSLTSHLEKWANTADLPFELIEHDGSVESVSVSLQNVLEGGADGLFAMTGKSRLILETFKRMGLKCPEDVLYVANGIGWLEEYMTPTITGLSFQPLQSAVLVAESIEKMVMRGENAELHLPCELVVRESTSR